MKTAVIYARYSSDAQSEQSIEGQMRVCNAYAEAHDLLIVKDFVDRAMTGMNDARPAFQQMLHESKKKQWEVVLVYKLDRFSRNKYESIVHKKALKDLGISVVSATENIPDTPEGVILESLLEGMNQYYSMELSQKIRRGQKESYIKGNYTGGKIQYGYRVEDKKYVVVEEEARVVQEVFAKYAQGYTVPSILDSFNARGILCRNAKRFTKKFLYKMLFRESYRGYAEHDGVLYDNIFPRIISEDLWDRVQQRHKEEALNPGSVKNESYLLTGKLYCGLCHKPMIGISGTSKTKGRKYYYYGCNRDRSETHCLMKMLNRTQIHNLVFNTIARVVANDDTILRIAKLIMEEHERGKDKNYTLQMLEAQKESTGRAITNIRRAIEAGIFDDQTKARLDELNLQMEQIENDIRRERVRTRPDLQITEVIDFLRAQFYGE